jgi:hypothetical protein
MDKQTQQSGSSGGIGTSSGVEGQRERPVASEFERRFSYHTPKPHQLPQYEQLRTDARALAGKINEFVPDSREKSLALTALEEAIFWANAGIARNT